jgi:hypothetical protein
MCVSYWLLTNRSHFHQRKEMHVAVTIQDIFKTLNFWHVPYVTSLNGFWALSYSYFSVLILWSSANLLALHGWRHLDIQDLSGLIQKGNNTMVFWPLTMVTCKCDWLCIHCQDYGVLFKGGDFEMDGMWAMLWILQLGSLQVLTLHPHFTHGIIAGLTIMDRNMSFNGNWIHNYLQGCW